ncbi:MAG: gamma-glutamyl-gamma-aminobutyrate hydrolase family protein [Vicinamibacterales bacterium]
MISPGPGRPEHAGVSLEVIRSLGQERPILGVCLGHQAIGMAFGGGGAGAAAHPRQDLGGRARCARRVRGSRAGRRGGAVSLPRRCGAGLPDALVVTARTRGDGIVMGLRHREWPVHGVQFHPESVLTPEGRQLLRNFLEL